MGPLTFRPPSPTAVRRPVVRRVAAGVAAAVLGCTTMVAGPVAAADPTSSLRAEAAALAAQLQARGVTLGQLSERYDAAELQLGWLRGRLASTTAALASTSRALAADEAVLRAEAVAAYMSGSQPQLLAGPGQAATDPSLLVGYVQVTAGVEHRAIAGFQALGRAQRAEQTVLVAEQTQARIGLQAVLAAEDQARGAASAEARTLSRVRGRLAVLVAEDQARAQAQEAALVVGPGADGSATTTTTLADMPTAPGTTPTTTAPATTTPATVTTTPAPPTTAPPTTAGPPPTTASTVTTTTTPPSPAPGPPASGAAAAIAYARAQLGKPYQWGGAGPDSFDCSGLVMRAWAAGGVSFPHLAQSQYDMTTRVPIADLEPGDLVFYGTPDDVYHVGLYVGGGDMIDAPSTGQVVRVESIYWSDLLGGGRVG